MDFNVDRAVDRLEATFDYLERGVHMSHLRRLTALLEADLAAIKGHSDLARSSAGGLRVLVAVGVLRAIVNVTGLVVSARDRREADWE